MKYLIVNINNNSSEALAKALSSAMWNITRPDKTADDTQYYCGWVSNNDKSYWALSLPDEDYQPIHPLAEQNIIALCDMIRPIITLDEKNALETFLLESRGSKINIVNALPPSLKSSLKTKEEMQLFGFFPEPNYG